jgi:hypothetical protein
MRDPILHRVSSIITQAVNRASRAGDPELAEALQVLLKLADGGERAKEALADRTAENDRLRGILREAKDALERSAALLAERYPDKPVAAAADELAGRIAEVLGERPSPGG